MADIDQFTAKLTPNTISAVTNQYFDLNEPFALPRYGNTCTPYTTGRDYMKAVADAIRGAKSFIFIADWQLDYDVELDNRGDPKHPGRLSELLADALHRGVHVRVILYDSVSSELNTHDDSTQSTLHKLPKSNGSISVILQNPHTGRERLGWQILDLANGSPTDANAYFSHHQKFVVLDGKQAFVGGIDLAHGRWDTNAFKIEIDPKIHMINDAYNMQIDPARHSSQDEVSHTQIQSNGRPGFAKSFHKEGKLFDPEFQPRQPWQDVAVGIDGPGAYDVFVNFVLRWNSFAGKDTNILNEKLDAPWFEKIGGKNLLVDPMQRGSGKTAVQICRSASSVQLKSELSLWNSRHKYIQDNWKSGDKQRAKVMEEARSAWAGNHQTSIRDAMINCIRAAQGFIYIENQFFVSNCGVDSRGTACPSNNPIISELANAIGKAIQGSRPFHVWITLPEQPEGKLEEATTASQGWWAMQGLKHANNSLINRINATILAKNKKAWGIEMPIRSNNDILGILKMHGMENKWRDYLTVLNLRNYGKAYKGVITEMIYVHSKLMIVDDSVAIIGSANINDRSLNGNGDTELSAVIVDDAEAQMTDVGGGVRISTRKFARDLRIQLWKKHLGMAVDESSTGVQIENDVPLGIQVDKPLEKSSIYGIQSLSITNRMAYNTVFSHTPRNTFKVFTEGRKAYIRKHYDASKKKAVQFLDLASMPVLQPEYMTSEGRQNVDKAFGYLRKSVKGFWVEMPLDWGHQEKKTPTPPVNSPTIIAQDKNEKEYANG